ncbi:PKD domain-containing protein [Carboxylicivirga mesophila]|uniref:PKD domain-containing protein n=1 Tax=Carboxylicivirga mesophila TaxID=1166478 RepID=A0ABS5KA77_9BACT|nr:LamG-like jellyroll fold domain-containing protein [Carboxylicivirga mesophila]MBS2211787.1 PKD domain-containing protein [Carboxylicivirga mesophila]
MKSYKLWSVMLPLLAFIVVGKLLNFNRKVSTSDNSTEHSDLPVWIDMMEQPDVNMQEARDAFDAYWSNHEHYQGDRHKQFERWYAINSKRSDENGHLIPAKAVSSAYRNMMNAANAEMEGHWYCYGPVNVGPRNGTKRDGGRVKDIQFHPSDPQTLYVSCFKSGLFKTMDGGASWEPLCDNIPEQVYVSAIKPSEPNTILIGTDMGVYITNDEGDTWNTTSITTEVKALLIQPGNENVIIAGAGNGIYRSANGGESWSLVQASSKVEDLKPHPTNPDILYAATNGATSQFYRSTDGGVSWTENTSFGQGCFMKIAVTSAAPDQVFVLNARDHLGDDSFEGFYKSTNAGVSFTKQSGTTPCITGYKDDGAISRGQPNYNLFVVVDPADASKVWAGGVKSWKSEDGGSTWTQFFNGVTTDGDNLHMDQLNWAFSPHNNALYAANDGGIYYLNDANQFQMITDGLPIAEVYECTQSQTKKTNVAGGTMHCGVKLNNNGVWYTPWGGDEATCIIDPTDEQYVYHLKYEKVSRSSNGGFNYSRINPDNTDRGEYTGTGVLHKSDVNTLFAGFKQLQRSNNVRAASVNWTTISSFAGTSKIQKVEQSGANEDVFYVARGTELYRSDNINAATPSYTNLTGNLPLSGVSVNDIAALSTDESVVFILQGSKVYRSSNKGASWTDLTSNLPAVALLEMTIDQTATEGIYVGTDIGVFYKESGMSDWINFSNGLPAVRVSGMDIYYGDTRDESLITVSTDGRGFWCSPLHGVAVEAPVANFEANYVNAVVGSSIQFTDLSTQHPQSYQWQFEGGSPATSLDINPIVRYDTPGTYEVSLTVANSAGTDTKTLTDYITVASEGGDLQVHYQFDGDAQDASLYHRDGLNAGVEFITDSKHGAVADFNGSAHITVPGYRGEEGTNARTISAWIKTSTNSKAIAAWGKAATSTKWAFRLETNGVLRLEPGGGNIIGSTNVADGQWHHVACVFDDDGSPTVDDVKLFVDGIEEVTYPSSVAINTVAQGDVTIGNDQMGRRFVGQMVDVRIYSSALSGGEITQLAATSTAIKQSVAGQWVNLYALKGGHIKVELLGSKSAQVSVYSLAGKMLKKEIIQEGVSTISLSSRQKELVVVQVLDSTKGEFVKKILLE